jgi:transcriptional regulator
MAPGSDLRLLAGIEGVELRLDRLEGKFKLSQNKSAADRASAAAALEAQGLPGGRAIAAAMRRATPED